MNLPIRLFVNSLVLISTLSSCGAQVDYVSTGSDSSNNDSSGATGGTSSTSTGKYNGGAIATGGALGPDPAYCNGILVKNNCGVFHRDTDSGAIACDVALLESPLDPSRTGVWIDCVAQPLSEMQTEYADAGAFEGFFIDYSQNPAHLILQGPGCDMLQSPGYHALDLIQGCQCVC